MLLSRPFFTRKSRNSLLGAVCVFACAVSAQAQEDSDWSFHAQATYAEQNKNEFASPYTGPHSLLTQAQGDIGRSYTLTSTAYLGRTLWEGAQFYWNPEMFQGLPFSNLSGLGGFNNGELQKGAEDPAIYYTARAFIRQTFGLGGGEESLPEGPNQIGQTVDKRRITVTYGTFSALDYFDANSYAHDPRMQFMNWSIMASGAYDYAANTRGYTYGWVGEYCDDAWVVRAARLAMPHTPNVLQLDYQLTQQYGDQLEITHKHEISGMSGALRFLAFQNRGVMATYQDAIALGQATNTTPNIFSVRTGEQTKHGYALNWEQAVTPNLGAFARWSWNDGKTETQAFTDINQSFSGGMTLKGESWGRANDVLGLGFANNGLSADAVAYLAQGGATMFLGDGRINYKREQILEAFYALDVGRHVTLTADVQRVNNPGYNADRGPVNFVGLRLHWDY